VNVVRGIAQWRSQRAAIGGSVGFVPTMGALHAGHASLVERSRAENGATVVSIYVNPTQFDQPADLARYPSTLDADLALLQSLGVDHVLLPTFDEIYPDGFRYRVEETQFSRELCGAHRANHFTGVLTVVLKLLNLVRPTRTYFGEKDYQQYLLVRDMVRAFFLDVDIVACPIVREADGLARSSRNVRLDAAARVLAPQLHHALSSASDDAQALTDLRRHGLDVEYVVTTHGRRFGAVQMHTRDGSVRLIDNVEVR